MTIDSLLAGALARDPAGPLLTYYDDATGERIELSATTFANWVAKTANLLQDELDVSAEDEVGILLPAHWQTAVILFGAWSVGARTTNSPTAQAVFCTDETLAVADADTLVALSLAPLGRPFTTPPEGAIDYAAVVPGQPDGFAAYDPPTDETAATADLTQGDVVEEAAETAAELGVRERDRVLTVLPWKDFDDWCAGLLAPLSVGASVVLCVNVDTDALSARAEAERVTATLGTEVAGIRRLDSR